jgi:putative membrane protein insertion efficiency factor
MTQPRSSAVNWILLHPLIVLGLYLVIEAFLPVYLQPTAWALRGAIRAYQATLSPVLPTQCKFTPTCSHYGLGCIQKYGTLQGSLLITWRLIRCSPLTHGGIDPVP